MSATRIFTALIAISVIAGLGLAAGFMLKNNLHRASAPAEDTDIFNAQNHQEEDAPAINDNSYDVSPPSRGGHISRVPVNFTPEEEDMAAISLDDIDAQGIAEGQHVLLYGADGNLLSILGEVTSVASSQNSEPRIEIKLNGETGHPSSDAVRGEIITDASKDAQRLPLTAIVQDNNGAPYLWEVQSAQDGSATARRIPVHLLAHTYQFIVVHPVDSTSNVFILNPDKDLRDGQQLTNIRKMLFTAPALTDDVRISQSVETRRLRGTKLDPYEGLAVKTAPCMAGQANGTSSEAGGGCGPAQGVATGAGATASSSSCGTTCGAQNDVIMDFIQKIRKSSASAQ